MLRVHVHHETKWPKCVYVCRAQEKFAVFIGKLKCGRAGEGSSHGRSEAPELAHGLGFLHEINLIGGGLETCLYRIDWKKDEVY